MDASAILRVVFSEPGPTVPLVRGERMLSSQLAAVETYRAIDRERLLGRLGDAETAFRRKEATDLLAMIDLVAIDGEVIEHAKKPFAVNVRALDAIHVATAEVVIREASGEELAFWTHDARQATAALSRGLTVLGV